jgi:hypothetical protein
MGSLVKDLIDRAQKLANRVDPGYRDRALEALDEACQWYASQVPWDSLKKTEDFTASGEFLILPDRVGKVVRLFDRTNQRPIEAGEFLERRMPSAYAARTTGQPCIWRDFGISPIAKDLSAASVLQFSTTASEGIDIQIRGLVQDTAASGTALEFYEVRETLTMAGVTQASANTYSKIVSIQKDHSTAEDVIVGTVADGQLARIPSWESRPRYPKLQLQPASSGTQVEVGFFRRPDRLTSEDDPLDPAINEEAVVWRTAGNLHWMDNEGQSAQGAWSKANEALAIKRNQEQTFGEKDHHIQPWVGYMSLESEYWLD